MNTATCIGEPISWLRLERHRLGELPATESAVVAAHVTTCPACAACLAETMLPLARPARPRIARGVLSFLAGAWRSIPHRPAIRLTLAGAAATLVLAVGLRTFDRKAGDGVSELGATLPGVKGGDLAMEMVRERDGAVAADAVTFKDGDRWKILVTCPAARVLFWEVVIHDGDSAAFPLNPVEPLPCGNRVPLPGAFRITGSRPATVCVMLSEAPLDRSRMASRLSSATPLCRTVGRE